MGNPRGRPKEIFSYRAILRVCLGYNETISKRKKKKERRKGGRKNRTLVLFVAVPKCQAKH